MKAHDRAVFEVSCSSLPMNGVVRRGLCHQGFITQCIWVGDLAQCGAVGAQTDVDISCVAPPWQISSRLGTSCSLLADGWKVRLTHSAVDRAGLPFMAVCVC